MAVNKDMNVLIVDDYNTMLRIIKNLLKQLGFANVDEAMDGQQAFKKVNMEPMTGLELLQAVRGSGESFAKTPFIMVTAESKTENVIAAKKAGVDNYIVKPFNAETLKTKMVSVIGEFE